MASQVDICNLALVRLGQDTIAAMYPTEQSTEARLATGLWTPVLRSALRSHPWNFALATAELTPTNDTPPDFTYEYQLPTDCVRALRLVNATYGTYKIRAEDKLVTNQEDAVLEYVAMVTDTTKFDDQFIEALSYRLAADLSLPLTGNAQMFSAMMKAYSNTVTMARQTDAQEIRPTDPAGTSILNSRL